MNQPLRSSSAASLIVLTSMIAGCAAPQAHVASATHFGGKADEEVGLATRALAALTSNNVPMAIDYAERAVATVRQNLALAYAFAGDWTKARTVAGQDVPANQLDARIHQWMQLASAKNASDQVAALVGVTPAQVDPGQPVRIALNKSDTQM